MGVRAKKLRSWYQQQPRLHKAAYIVAALIALIIVVNLAVTGYAWYESIKEGLSIYVEPDQRSFEVEQASNYTASFALATNNAPFCSATCTYQLIDHRGQEVLLEGERRIASSEQATITYTGQAPATQRYTTPLQLITTCRNDPRAFCQRDNEQATTTATTTKTVVYNQEAQQQANILEQELPRYNQQYTNNTQHLRALSQQNDTRTQALTQQARSELEELQAHHQALHQALSSDDLQEALTRVNNPPPTTSAQTYQAILEAEQQAVTTYQALSSDQEALNALQSIANSSEQRTLSEQLRAVEQTHQAFASQDPRTSQQAIQALRETSQALINERNASTQQAAHQARELLQQELTMTCTLKNTTCRQLDTSQPTTFTQAVNVLQETCSELQALPEVFLQAHESYAQQLRTNQSVQATEEEYNLSSVRAQSGYDEQEEQLLAQARNNTRTTSNQTLLLAAQLRTSNQTRQHLQTHCPVTPRELPLPQPAPQATLQPLNTSEQLTPAPAQLQAPTCCNHLTCTQCNQPRTVTLFVHGHSFAQTAAPESSLHAFDELALALQEDAGMYYAGRLFARQPSPTNYHSLTGPLSFSTTYYYNSYAEQANTYFIVQKNHNIETYALRLQEVIQEAKRTTGTQQVQLVTHSMGGLVARSYLQIFGTQDVDKLVMVGTPNHGISGRTARLCPVIGGAQACEDMQEGSIFLRRLPAQTSVDTLTIAGVGCGENGDGVVTNSSVHLSGAEQLTVQGVCEGSRALLHNHLLDPEIHPEVLQAVNEFLNN